MAVRENQSPTATAMTAITAAVILAACAASRAPLRVTGGGVGFCRLRKAGSTGICSLSGGANPREAVMPIYGKARGEG